MKVNSNITTKMQQLLSNPLPPCVSHKWSSYCLTLDTLPRFILQLLVQITALRMLPVKVPTNLLPLLLLRSTFNKSTPILLLVFIKVFVSYIFIYFCSNLLFQIVIPRIIHYCFKLYHYLPQFQNLYILFIYFYS